MAAKPETITITNFGGRLTRIVNGDLNSGFAKFATSWGYDPFSKPMNLSWFEKPTDISTGITDLVVAAKPRYEGGTQYVYAVGNSGKLYKIQPNSNTNANVDSVVGIASVGASSVGSGAISFAYAPSMEFFGNTEKIYVASDTQINSINFDGSADTLVTNKNYVSSVGGHVLKPFIGDLIFGNGNTIGAIDSTGTVVSSVIGTGQGNLYSEFNPPLPVSNKVHDIDDSPEGNYVYVTASQINNEPIGNFDTTNPAASSEAYIYRWNGIDDAVTGLNKVPSYAVTALQTYLNSNMFFSHDAFGASLFDGTSKLISLPNNRSPLPNSVLINGNFISWIAPEIVGGNEMSGSLYYFGALDQENPSGLYRVMRYAAVAANGFIYQTPVNILTNNKTSSLNITRSSILTVGYGKHYFSTWETSDNVQTTYKLFRFLVTPTGTGTPQEGVYETQTQIFSKKIDIKQIRIYTEPTVANNGFQIDIIGNDGSIMTNGTFNYTFVAGSDETRLQGSLERINFNPTCDSLYGFGIRITNTGTTNMCVKKIEIDWTESGK